METGTSLRWVVPLDSTLAHTLAWLDTFDSLMDPIQAHQFNEKDGFKILLDGTSRIKMARIHSMLGRILMGTGLGSILMAMLLRILGSRTMKASGIG